jgi:long-chain acyl-CoA synthetase
MSGKTWPETLQDRYRQHGGRKVAMRNKEFGVWREYTWKDYYENVKHLGLGMMELGLKRSDKVMVIGYNGPYSYWAILGVMAARGVITMISPDATPAEMKEFLNHSDSRFAIVEDQEQVEKLLRVKEELPELEQMIYWNPKGLLDHHRQDLLGYQQVIQKGKEFEQAHPGFFEQFIEASSEDDIALLMYTSGTRAAAKGVLLTHQALISSAQKCIEAGSLKESFQIFSHVPLAWFPAFILEMGVHLMGGMTVNFAEGPDTILRDMREIGPHFVIFTPRQWEGLVKRVRVRMSDAGLLKRLCYRVFLPVGYMISGRQGRVSLLWKFFYLFAFFFLFRPLKDKLGLLHVKLSLTGGGPISTESLRFLNALGLSLRQTYGMMEMSPITWQTDGDFKLRSVGRPVRGTEVILSEEGEILARGDHMFQGYYKDSGRTEAVLKEGWIHTGDAGRIDPDGHLIYEGCLPDMIQTDQGKRFAPEPIEGILRYDNFIKDALVLRRSGMIALVQIDFETVGKWAEKNDIHYITLSDLSQKLEVHELIGKAIREANRALPEEMRIVKYFILDREFKADDLELTRSGKLRRCLIIEKYRHLWEERTIQE